MNFVWKISISVPLKKKTYSRVKIKQVYMIQVSTWVFWAVLSIRFFYASGSQWRKLSLWNPIGTKIMTIVSLVPVIVQFSPLTLCVCGPLKLEDHRPKELEDHRHNVELEEHRPKGPFNWTYLPQLKPLITPRKERVFRGTQLHGWWLVESLHASPEPIWIYWQGGSRLA